MASLPENSGAEMDSMILSNDLLTQLQRTLAETSPGQMQADLQTILAASMSMAPSVGSPDGPHDCCSWPDRLPQSFGCSTFSVAFNLLPKWAPPGMSAMPDAPFA